MTEEHRLTHRELDVMSILWREGSGTVAEVRAGLADPLAYTSVLWVLQTLESKGRVRHAKEGRAYRYYPVTDQDEAGGSALGRIMDKVFHGSAAMLLAQLVSERALPPEELQRMRDLLDERLAEREEP
ncbi:MAG TPA: BlaI/MecI/CopY family transcriptional regulator [Longimicrobiaceae bacterium]|jgi:predicted transcriptional regulator|nr:BlaI/MecI/CopY family transcriptional regulator [Longimicrobiaceae bacterium]